jgi:F0F1-type ATP synthase delta subunit
MATERSRTAGVIAAHTLSKGVTKKYAREVAALLLSTRRVGQLDSLLRDVQADWAEAGYVEVLAYSAHELNSATKNDIAARVKKIYPAAKDVVITEVRDSAVLGGVRISLPNQQLDLSIEAKLNRFKQLTGAGKE